MKYILEGFNSGYVYCLDKEDYNEKLKGGRE